MTTFLTRPWVNPSVASATGVFAGEHGLPLRPRAARIRVSGKHMEVGGLQRGVNHDKTIANAGLDDIGTPPHSGEGCGDTLTGGIYLKERSNFG